MGKFQTVTYEIHNRKIKNKEGVRFAFLADLHGSCFGEDNADLLGEIDRYAPDAVLIAGDMAVRMEPQTLETAQKLLEKLAVRYPVFYGPGNHESKMSGAEHPYRNEYLNYRTLSRGSDPVFQTHWSYQFPVYSFSQVLLRRFL